MMALAAVALSVPWPAGARPPETLACGVKAAPEGLDIRVADAILVPGTPTANATQADLRAITDACAADQLLNDKQREAYFSYTWGRMGRDALDGRLAALGIRSGLIDQALDIGPGNTNNPADKVTQGDLRIVGEALDKAGKPPASVTAQGWELITGWIVATALMFDGQRDLD
ncbi:hypothetical protein [Novosphingobium sp. SG916]|nr:hypothetical protein [Novosphingobium sp. SG916]NMN88898.1 hypothetical protein [Novosphingobium sp. SG916]